MASNCEPWRKQQRKHGKQFETPEGNRFWRADNQPVELWSNVIIDQKLNYIHQNPVEDGLVYRVDDYVYSSAADYAIGKGLLYIYQFAFHTSSKGFGHL